MMSEAPLGLEIDEFGRVVCIIPGSVSPFPELRPEHKLARLMAEREEDGELVNDFLDDLSEASIWIRCDSCLIRSTDRR